MCTMSIHSYLNETKKEINNKFLIKKKKKKKKKNAKKRGFGVLDFG